MSSLQQKQLAFEELVDWRKAMHKFNWKLVVTSGCFDIIHSGHVQLLEQARALGDFLLVGVNGDDAVRELKGPSRPVHCIGDRLRVIAAMESVDACVEFRSTRATDFLIDSQPDIWVKGGDYTMDSLHGPERAAVEFSGGRIVLVNLEAGLSTTRILEQVNSAPDG